MYQLDRYVAIIRPEQPLLDWLNGLAEFAPLELTLEQVGADCTALLIPEFEDDDEAVAFVYQLWDQLFESELQDWTDNRALWPQGRSAALFIEWFSIEIHTTVVELADEEPPE
ncbi:MAG TPA: hypothetical protein VLC55_09315 [Burkholderiales bacterium]|nr:hypothetical protein [Burkholderiales bacterium]